MPRPADSTVPAVEGSTKRLRASICMIVPHTAMPAPAKISASVRGIRTSTSTSRAVAFSPDTRPDSEMSLTPMRTLATDSSNRAVRAKKYFKTRMYQ